MQWGCKAKETLFHKCIIPLIKHILAFRASLIMPFKCCLIQLKSASATTVLSSKKKIVVETSLVLNLVQLEIDDNKLSTADIGDTKDTSRSQF